MKEDVMNQETRVCNSEVSAGKNKKEYVTPSYEKKASLHKNTGANIYYYVTYIY